MVRRIMHHLWYDINGVYLNGFPCVLITYTCTLLTFSLDSTGKRKCQEKNLLLGEVHSRIVQDMRVTEHTREQSRPVVRWGQQKLMAVKYLLRTVRDRFLLLKMADSHLQTLASWLTILHKFETFLRYFLGFTGFAWNSWEF